MGRKSREKRERRLARINADSRTSATETFVQERAAYEAEQEKRFCNHLEAIKRLLQQYRHCDVAIALCISELWPVNVGSSVKHTLVWRLLLGLQGERQEGKTVRTYEEFRGFVEALYATWPDFPMLEDFSPEADWGHVKVCLDGDFVPIFYGSCLERTPDFVEAFRITYADQPRAQAHMDLVVAMQAQIIESFKDLRSSEEGYYFPGGHVELPSEEFWAACRSTILNLQGKFSNWCEAAAPELETKIGSSNPPITWESFGDAAIQGNALPYVAVRADRCWVPMSVRGAPACVIEHWASKTEREVGSSAHRQLGQFVAKRFRNVVVGPLVVFIDDEPFEDLPVSCVVPNSAGVYLICACSHSLIKTASSAAATFYRNVRESTSIRFHLRNGYGFTLSKEEGDGPGVDDVRVILVLTLESAAHYFLEPPERPARLLPLADFITIFDSIKNLQELEDFWRFADLNQATLNPFSTSPADLYASFKDSDALLVEGAEAPTQIMLDPQWGTRRRFQTLAEFWSLAPRIFPDQSTGWRVSPGTEGVVELQSRNKRQVVYSTTVGMCTIQTLVEISPSSNIESLRMVNLVAQIIVDCSYHVREHLQDIPVFQRQHLLLVCAPDSSYPISANDAPKPKDQIDRLVTSANEEQAAKGVFHVRFDATSIFSGLNESEDASFEVRCLIETLQRCHNACGLSLPSDLEDRLKSKSKEQARYHVSIYDRNVDVPDYVKPVIPAPTDYKHARKRLASEIKSLGLSRGRFQLADAKAKIDPAGIQLLSQIENRLSSLDRKQLLRALVEQHDALLCSERLQILRARQSLAHEVEYDRLEAIEQARKDFALPARHYRYLLEKAISAPGSGKGDVVDVVLRELVALVDWYMVLRGASDTLHNGVDVAGVDIDDSFLPEVFYSDGADRRESEFGREYAKTKLEIEANAQDVVEGDYAELLSSKKLNCAFYDDAGFEYRNLIASLGFLSQAQRHGFSDELSLSYRSSPEGVINKITESIEGIDAEEVRRIVEFLTLSHEHVLKLSGSDVDERDVPHWEHRKRLHRYAIRPLVADGSNLLWGAETASRAMFNWLSVVRDGYLPADFEWPLVEGATREIKKSIERRLEVRAAEVFRRHTRYVEHGIDFSRRFKSEGFEKVGDFDVLAYWPGLNLIVTVECKYNQPAYTTKDARRLRDKIFGSSEDDRKGQFSRLKRRRIFLEENRARMLKLLDWPEAKSGNPRNLEVYVSRDLYYWFVHPPYPVPTQFVRVDALETWIRKELSSANSGG